MTLNEYEFLKLSSIYGSDKMVKVEMDDGKYIINPSTCEKCLILDVYIIIF